MHVVQVIPDGVAAAAGVKAGDLLVALGDVPLVVAQGQDPFDAFRSGYANREGEALPIRVRRGGQELVLPGTVRLRVVTTSSIVLDPAASPRALRVRHGLFAGVTE